MTDFEKPNFYAILPANVRYDKNIPPNAKLFYAEITSILQHNNRCYASNSYFSRVFNITEIQVSRIIKKLIEAGYISVDYKATSKGTQRFIALNINVNAPVNINDKSPLNINVKDNSSNNNSNNSSTIVEDKGAKKEKTEKKKTVFIPPTLQEVKDYFKEKGYSEISAGTAFEYYNVADWKDAKGSQVKNWKQKMISVWFKPENKAEEQKKFSL